jgi:hypothetical protein
MTDGATTTNRRNGTSTMTDAKKPGKPWWRPLVNEIDRIVTPPTNRIVRTNMFADSVAMMTRLEVRLRRRIERQSTWLLHQYNLPAAADIRKVRAQLAAVEARLRDVSERLEDQQHEAETRRAESTSRTAATNATRTKATSKNAADSASG